MTGAAAIRWATVGAVGAVAGVAAWASYEHAYAVVSSHGEFGAVAVAYPATVDGLIFAASMVLLDSARRNVPAPRLARWLLGAGIAATLFVNVLSGLKFGPLGAAVSAWPALALVGSYELLMLIIRSADDGSPQAAGRPAPRDVSEAVRLARLAADAAGEALSERQLATRFGISRRQVGRALAHANGAGSR